MGKLWGKWAFMENPQLDRWTRTFIDRVVELNGI